MKPATVSFLSKKRFQVTLKFEYYTRAAAKATDILLAEIAGISPFPVEGWIVATKNDSPLFIFVGSPRGEVEAIFTVRPDAPEGQRLTGRLDQPCPLSPEEKGQYEARLGDHESQPTGAQRPITASSCPLLTASPSSYTG